MPATPTVVDRVPKDPEIRNLRSVIGAARRDGKPDVEASARRRLSVIHTERQLVRALPDLNSDDRMRFVGLILGAEVR